MKYRLKNSFPFPGVHPLASSSSSCSAETGKEAGKVKKEEQASQGFLSVETFQ